MDESLMEQRRVSDDGLRVVNSVNQDEWFLRIVEDLTVPEEKATANYVPAAAVYVGGKRCPELLGVKSLQAVCQSVLKSSGLNPVMGVETANLGIGVGKWNS